MRKRKAYFRTVVFPRYETLLTAKNAGDKEAWAAAKAEFEDLLRGESPFLGFVRCFARRKKLDGIGVDIPDGPCEEA